MIAPHGLTWERFEFDHNLAWKLTAKFKHQSTYFAESRPIYPTETQAISKGLSLIQLDQSHIEFEFWHQISELRSTEIRRQNSNSMSHMPIRTLIHLYHKYDKLK